NHSNNKRFIRDARQLDSSNTASPNGGGAGGNLSGEPGLADARRPDNGDESASLEQPGELSAFRLTTYEGVVHWVGLSRLRVPVALAGLQPFSTHTAHGRIAG